ncbi:MAG: hypothetical protein ACI94Y_004412 [Maribacter sp.]|jgi:hypothetical protein
MNKAQQYLKHQNIHTPALLKIMSRFLRKKMLLTRLNLKGIENKLSSTQFMRIHRSYIVAISKITAFNKSQISIGNTQIPRKLLLR